MVRNANIEDYENQDVRKAVRGYNSDYGLMMTLSSESKLKEEKK